MTGNTTEIQWYIARDGQQHGPISETEMRLFVDNGYLRPSDLLWKPGFAEWRPASAVFPAQSAPAADVPEPASAAGKAVSGDASAEEQPAAASAGARAASAAAQAAPQPEQRKMADAPANMNKRPADAPAPAKSGPSPAGAAGPMSARAGAANGPNGAPRGPAGPARGPEPQPHGAADAARAALRTAAQPGGQLQNRPAPASAYAPSAAYAPAGSVEPAAAPAPSGGGKKFALAVVLLAMIAGSIGFLAMQKDSILAMVGAGAPPEKVPVVKAEPEPRPAMPQQTAALQKPVPAAVAPAAPTAPPSEAAEPPAAAPQSAPPAQQQAAAMPPASAPAAAVESVVTPTATAPVDETASVDAYYQKSALWQYMKREYPDWYSARMKELVGLGSGAEPSREATQKLVEGLVQLRRSQSDEALKAGADRLKGIATAFLANLQALSETGAETCYGFISQGESSPKTVDLFHRPASSPALEGQAVKIFEAIAAGKASPAQHERPKKGDYDLLAAELGKLGWSQADLQLFADPKALSNAQPARVCAMVRDWFRAHISISDAAVQERLLFETLRPVVAG